ncbi:hypothetical protein BASA81_009738 [Batrachochytrium salamandrivorans]|nr:hypothetical protein BASA81_009738 [Batrachochytrium salamandrivorans]
MQVVTDILFCSFVTCPRATTRSSRTLPPVDKAGSRLFNMFLAVSVATGVALIQVLLTICRTRLHWLLRQALTVDSLNSTSSVVTTSSGAGAVDGTDSQRSY